jgi:archaetidylinositol phosphate synthase
LERPALAWLARKVPTSITPDHLSAIGFGGAVIAAVAYAASGSHPNLLWLASLGLVINWFGDSLDGTVARLRRIERPRYGYYLDNAVDCIAQLLLAAGIGFSGYVRFDLCLFALAAYLMVSTLSFIRANVTNVFQLAYAAVGPTEVRVGFVVLNALLIIFPPDTIDWGLPLTYPNLWSLAWSSSMLVTFLVTMVKQVRELAVEEPRSASVSHLAHEPPPRLATAPIPVVPFSVNSRLPAGSTETSPMPESSF